MRIAVAEGSAYDLFLTRALHHAVLLRFADSAAATATFMREGLDALAGVRQPLAGFAADHPEVRVVPGSFMQIRQAMCVPVDRAPHSAPALLAFLEAMKESGFVARALAETGQDAALVAPPAK